MFSSAGVGPGLSWVALALYATPVMQMSRPPFRFAILGESHHLPAWAAEAIRHLLASGRAELVLFIRGAADAGLVMADAPRGDRGPGALYRLYEEMWLKRRSRALQTTDLRKELGQVEQIAWVTDHRRPHVSDDVLQKLRAHDLDFILALGSRAPRGALLNMARLGVWSFAHDRAPAPFLQEILAGAPRTRVSLDRLGIGPGEDVSLHQGFFGTCKGSWVNNVDSALLGCTDFCTRACAELSHAEDGELRREPNARPQVEMRAPGNRELVRFLLKSGSNTLAKLWELFFHVEVWNVGFTRASIQQILRDTQIDHGSVTWCKPHKPDHFIADPFVYSHEGEQHVLVEDYVLGKGRICRLVEPDAGEALGLTVDFDLPYHMSYPCTFCDEGEIYCIPETYQFGKAALYRRVKGNWELVRTLLEGLPVVDPTLFKHNGLYWILFTLQNDGAWGNLKLHAYYAERLDAEWKPHLLNPIKCDIGSTRPAGGVVWIDGHLYRPSQDCSTTYGGAVVMNRIVELTPTKFGEVEAARIEPIRMGPYPAGLHTINAMGERTVIDSKKFAFDPLAWRKNWGRLHEIFN